MTNRLGSFFVDCLAAEVLRLGRGRTIGYIHTSGFGDLARRNRVFGLLVRRLLASAERIVCLSPTLAGDLNGLTDVPISVIPNAVPEPVASPASPSMQEGAAARRVLFVSNLIPEKGIADFMRLANDLAFNGFQFMAAGAPAFDGQIAQLEREAAGRVELLGAVPHDEVMRLMATADLLVFPSRYPFEAQPLTILESLAQGLPVVAYRIGGIGDIVPESAGVVVPEGAYDQLRDAVADLLGNHALRASLAGGARQTHRCEHSLAVYGSRWKEILG